MIKISTYTGKATEPFYNDLARLRLAVFSEYPYLYNGDMEEEHDYLKAFFEAKNSILSLAQEGNQVVGASTGLPMVYETPNVQQPFLESGYDVSKIFYFSESVLDKNYRGKGIGVAFFKHREAWARELGFERAVFCGVVRPEDHPLRPKDYVPLDAFWAKRGYSKMENKVCYMTWRDWNEAAESPKPLVFWTKILRG